MKIEYNPKADARSIGLLAGTVTEKIDVADLPEFDVVDFLRTDEDIANYLTVVIEDNDAALLEAAMGDVARARGMTEFAKP